MKKILCLIFCFMMTAGFSQSKEELKKGKKTTVNGSDFSMSDAHIAEQYQPNDMIIKHVEVPEGDTSYSVNIDNLIASL